MRGDTYRERYPNGHELPLEYQVKQLRGEVLRLTRKIENLNKSGDAFAEAHNRLLERLRVLEFNFERLEEAYLKHVVITHTDEQELC